MRGLLLGCVLSMVLAGANAYLGLKVGMTVSASIPAAVLAMAVFKLLRRGSILESNQVQTAASAGEALAAGAIFTLPALILLGQWRGFPYGATTVLLLLGGLFGVAFSVPLRRVLVRDPSLGFPEGVATAEVLKAGHAAGGGVKALAWGGAAAFAIKVCQSGLRLLAGSAGGGVVAGRAVFAGGADFSAALLAVGAVLRFPIAVLVFIGGVIAWGVAIPVYTAMHGVPEADSLYAAAFTIWNTKIRYMGVGAMVIGGIWSLVSLIGPIVRGLKESWAADAQGTGHTDRDTPLPILGACLVVLGIPLYLVYRTILPADAPVLALVVVLALAYIGGLVFSAVAGYMAGLVGSSHNPVSGVTIATILATSFLLLGLLGGQSDTAAAASMAILVGAVVCCAAAISGDNLQDLKAGHLLGATPWRQQVMQVVGVVSGALVLGPVLNLLYQAYGIGVSLPRADMDPAAALAAPQASLMKAVAQGVFERNLPWGMIGIGMAVAVAVIVIDQVLKAAGSRYRAPVLAVAVGIYLPIELTFPLAVGGALASLALPRTGRKPAGSKGLLLASGLIAGEALAGIALAIPFAAAQRTDVFVFVPESFAGIARVFGVIVFLAVAAWLYIAHRRVEE